MKRLLDMSGKKPERQLTMQVTEREPELERALTTIFRRVYPDRDIASMIRRCNLGEECEIAWMCEGTDEQFGFVVRTLQAAQLQLESEELSKLPREREVVMVITSGENELYAAVRRIIERLYPDRVDTMLVQKHIHVGDITWTCKREAFGYIIERKEKADFVKSIKDKRHKTQLAAELLTKIDTRRILTFVHGDVTDVVHGPNNSARVGSMIYPIIRHGTGVWQAQDINQVAIALVNMHLQMEYCAEEKLKAEGAFISKYIIDGGVTKKKMMNSEKFGITLALVNGVSPEVALAIAAVYPSIAHLMHAYERVGIEKIDFLLAPIRINERRRVGEALSRRVAEFFEVRNMMLLRAGQPIQTNRVDPDEDNDDSDAESAAGSSDGEGDKYTNNNASNALGTPAVRGRGGGGSGSGSGKGSSPARRKNVEAIAKHKKPVEDEKDDDDDSDDDSPAAVQKRRQRHSEDKVQLDDVDFSDMMEPRQSPWTGKAWRGGGGGRGRGVVWRRT